MSIVSRSEFAVMCGVKEGTLRQHINRNKVICQGDGGKIDTEHPVNVAYMKQQRSAAKDRNEMAVLIASIPKAAPRNEKRKRVIDDDEEEDDDDPPAIDPEILSQAPDDDEGMGSWIKRKLKAETLWVERKAEREKLLLDKAAGKMMPVDLVNNMIEIYAKDLKTGYEEGLENIATIFCQIMAGGDIKRFNEVMERCRELLEKCWQEAGAKIDADIENAVDDFIATKKL